MFVCNATTFCPGTARRFCSSYNRFGRNGLAKCFNQPATKVPKIHLGQSKACMCTSSCTGFPCSRFVDAPLSKPLRTKRMLFQQAFSRVLLNKRLAGIREERFGQLRNSHVLHRQGENQLTTCHVGKGQHTFQPGRHRAADQHHNCYPLHRTSGHEPRLAFWCHQNTW